MSQKVTKSQVGMVQGFTGALRHISIELGVLGGWSEGGKEKKKEGAAGVAGEGRAWVALSVWPDGGRQHRWRGYGGSAPFRQVLVGARDSEGG